jgi:hypothetical protein
MIIAGVITGIVGVIIMGVAKGNLKDAKEIEDSHVAMGDLPGSPYIDAAVRLGHVGLGLLIAGGLAALAGLVVVAPSPVTLPQNAEDERSDANHPPDTDCRPARHPDGFRDGARVRTACRDRVLHRTGAGSPRGPRRGSRGSPNPAEAAY